VGEFADMGYLPEALRNYLARLGWGHGDDEIFSDADAEAWFDVRDVVKAPARLDWAKLNHLNQHYIRVAEDARLGALVRADLQARGIAWSPAGEARLERVIGLVKEAAQTIPQLADLCVFALKDRALDLDDKTKGLLDDAGRGRLARLIDHFSQSDTAWTRGALEPELRVFAAAEGVGLGKIGPLLRGVLSGGAPAPDLAGALAALGRDEALGRVSDALSQPQ
jgi:glutamyl-tRNA synthetase